ncbi:hypothetical protein RHSIM_Rhsim05G0053400 [Rhododendron simsii]|uniref:BED-type domain-containing protein n=1 Tax=Rhododendron simsii TaxID=118357 RepID=A0A834GWF1_RHOSS|nr:hypothetical protein RHSIM_Rhsim05G0053400 [Rhododendron simsii]
MSMNPTHIPSSEASNSAPLLKRNSIDVGWDYGVIVDPSNKDRLQCLLCGNQYTGGVSRMKRHIAQTRGDVASCTKASKEDILKCKKAIDDNAAKKKNKKKAAMEIREEVNIVDDESEGDEIENVAVGSKKRPYVLGPMDKYTNINPESSDTSGFKKMRQPNINDTIWKEKSHKCSYLNWGGEEPDAVAKLDLGLANNERGGALENPSYWVRSNLIEKMASSVLG